MNILDKIATISGMSGAKLGFMPDKPDAMFGLFEYSGSPPEHSFGSTNHIHNVQVRTRDKTAATAYAKAEAAANALNRYHDGEISILQTSSILDIGKDTANPPRQEYTVNFEIRRY